MPDLDPAARVAAVKDIAVALLPVSATQREKALLAAELARLSTYDPDVIATVWDPAICPVALLPWLAWALSVDVWDATWPEATRRAVIAAAPGVHRLKGTRAAVQKALDALGIVTDIVEWWETEPPGRRGTATITAYIGADFGDGVILSERVQRQAIASIRAAKPKSRFVSYRIGVGFAAGAGLAGAVQSAVLADPTLEAVSPMPAATIGALGTLQNAAFIHPSASAISAHPQARLSLAGVLGCVQFLALTMEVTP